MSFPGQNMRIAWPPLTRGLKILLITYAVLFVATLFKGSLGFEGILREHLYLSWEGMFSRWNLWQPLTYQLLHSDFFHIMFNSLVLYSFGGEVERKWGTWPFVRFALLCGLGSAVVILGWQGVEVLALGQSGTPVVGASGAIYGVITAFCLMNWNRRMRMLFIPGEIEAKWLLAIFFGLDLLFVMLGSDTSLTGHAGGALTGALIVTGVWKPSRLMDHFKLWRARRRLRLLRGGHPLESKGKDDPPRFLH